MLDLEKATADECRLWAVEQLAAAYTRSVKCPGCSAVYIVQSEPIIDPVAYPVSHTGFWCACGFAFPIAGRNRKVLAAASR